MRSDFTKDKNIKVKDVCKYFGKTQVLDHVNMECRQGAITGIIGRNGAGKTVLFKIICGLLSLDSGEILINGIKRERQADVLPSVGIIIEEPAFLKYYSGIKNLEYLYMINHKNNRQYLESIMEKVGLDPKSKKHVGKYSMGMRQRLAIAQSIMEEPDFLVLDEPFNGLDSHGVNEMRELFLELKKRGKVILIASHNSEDINILCDNVYSMESGVLKVLR
jgi:ABC-2 type transport system ATP-binding protein